MYKFNFEHFILIYNKCHYNDTSCKKKKCKYATEQTCSTTVEIVSNYIILCTYVNCN